MIFNSIKTAAMRNSANFGLHTNIKDTLAECNPETMRIVPQYQRYLACYARQDEAFKKTVKSPITKRLHEADRVRDEAWSALVSAVSAALKRPVEAIKEKAYNVIVVLDGYGNVAKKPLNEETALIDNLVQDLESAKLAPDVAAIGVGQFVEELKACNEAFRNLAKSRYNEAADKCDIVLKEARKETDEAYRHILKCIEVFISMHGEADYERFVRLHNLIIVKFKSAMRSGFSALQGEELDEEEGT